MSVPHDHQQIDEIPFRVLIPTKDRLRESKPTKAPIQDDGEIQRDLPMLKVMSSTSWNMAKAFLDKSLAILEKNFSATFMANGREYIVDPSLAPPGVVVEQGERGGYYYETGPRQPGEEDDPEENENAELLSGWLEFLAPFSGLSQYNGNEYDYADLKAELDKVPLRDLIALDTALSGIDTPEGKEAYRVFLIPFFRRPDVQMYQEFNNYREGNPDRAISASWQCGAMIRDFFYGQNIDSGDAKIDWLDRQENMEAMQEAWDAWKEDNEDFVSASIDGEGFYDLAVAQAQSQQEEEQEAYEEEDYDEYGSHGDNPYDLSEEEVTQWFKIDGVELVAKHWDGQNFKANLHAADGSYMGNIERTFYWDRGEVHHDYFVLESEYQGGGTAAEVNARAADFYREHGIDRISVQADIDVGKYVWAQQGFDFADSYEVHSRRDKLKAFVRDNIEEHYEPLPEDSIQNVYSSLSRVVNDPDIGYVAADIRSYMNALQDASPDKATEIIQRMTNSRVGGFLSRQGIELPEISTYYDSDIDLDEIDDQIDQLQHAWDFANFDIDGMQVAWGTNSKNGMGHVGKAFMLEKGSWDGVRYLDESSESWKVGEHYIQNKIAAKKAKQTPVDQGIVEDIAASHGMSPAEYVQSTQQEDEPIVLHLNSNNWVEIDRNTGEVVNDEPSMTIEPSPYAEAAQRANEQHYRDAPNQFAARMEEIGTYAHSGSGMNHIWRRMEPEDLQAIANMSAMLDTIDYINGGSQNISEQQRYDGASTMLDRITEHMRERGIPVVSSPTEVAPTGNPQDAWYNVHRDVSGQELFTHPNRVFQRMNPGELAELDDYDFLVSFMADKFPNGNQPLWDSLASTYQNLLENFLLGRE